MTFWRMPLLVWARLFNDVAARCDRNPPFIARLAVLSSFAL